MSHDLLDTLLKIYERDNVPPKPVQEAVLDTGTVDEDGPRVKIGTVFVRCESVRSDVRHAAILVRLSRETCVLIDLPAGVPAEPSVPAVDRRCQARYQAMHTNEVGPLKEDVDRFFHGLYLPSARGLQALREWAEEEV